MNLKRQWKRSSLIGFIRRLLYYGIGHRCYMLGCDGRIKYKGDYRVGSSIRSSVNEHWECDKCKATLGDCY